VKDKDGSYLLRRQRGIFVAFFGPNTTYDSIMAKREQSVPPARRATHYRTATRSGGRGRYRRAQKHKPGCYSWRMQTHTTASQHSNGNAAAVPCANHGADLLDGVDIGSGCPRPADGRRGMPQPGPPRKFRTRKPFLFFGVGCQPREARHRRGGLREPRSGRRVRGGAQHTPNVSAECEDQVHECLERAARARLRVFGPSEAKCCAKRERRVL
jgi:hypothetical protein